ncbi:hypothetical protein AQUCO_00600269v1 [Aquilegia coerulea]|uniref:DNA polymerase delta subunit 4 n=1 Tax=Aquilegia coerulea TaxID=218851 RepID=A0A2G5ENS2_AQUCA|nr:hypothetical protein AQUCO_00600269v1 [Aquilegia coerulea]
MASRGRGGGLGVVYRQKKKTGGGGVSTTNTTAKNKKSSVTFGSDVTQPKALISLGSIDLKDDNDEQEEVLRQFDMNMAYGPCIGLTRLARWERANKLGMNPPKHIQGLLEQGKVGLECLWDGRV